MLKRDSFYDCKDHSRKPEIRKVTDRFDVRLDAALNVSEYTDKIDIISYSNKAKRIVAQIRDLCCIISGLLVAGDYKTGAQLFAKNHIRDNEEIFQRIFEVGRR